MKIKAKILKESGYEEALLGLSLSFNANYGRMQKRLEKLAPLDGGHNKALESICVWLDITAPRYWWQQFDTYRIGITKQSESTMHTILKRPLCQEDFVEPINEDFLWYLNYWIKKREFNTVKVHLPEGFLQRRIVCTNYKTLRHVYHQRATHRLEEWDQFLDEVLSNLSHPKFIKE